MKSWLIDEFAWLGFILTAVIGGVVGYIKSYELANVETTWRFKAWALLRRVIMAGFAGWLLYQLSLEYHIPSAWVHIIGGIIGMFAAEAFEVAWTIVRARMLSLTGTTEK